MKTKSIKNIKVGDYVQSYDHKEDKIVSAKVTEIFKHKDVPGMKIVINQNLTATGNHPLHINGKYKPAARAKVGDIVIDPDGIEIKIHTLVVKPMKIDVYNIEVEGDHNYFAGGMLNHNKCGEYSGDDDVMSAALSTVESAADVYQSQLGGYITSYYDQVHSLVGTGIADPTAEGMDFSYVDEAGATQTFDVPTLGAGNSWSEDSGGGGLTQWGALVKNFDTANAAYGSAQTDAAGKIIAAEETMGLVEEDVTTALETTGESIASEAEGALQDVQMQTAAQGFAATGEEAMMKKDVRTSQGTAWSTATDTAQSNLASAIKDYESAMGSGETVEVGGEETEAIGTVQAGLDSALDTLVTAEGALRTGVGSINEALKQERTSFVNSLQGAKTNFSSSVSDAYLTPNIDTYIVDADQIITDTETGINTHLFGEGAGDFNTAKWNEFGYNPAATTDMATDSSVAGDVGGEKWSGLGWMTAGWGIGTCLEGNVKVVMGGKNGSN